MRKYYRTNKVLNVILIILFLGVMILGSFLDSPRSSPFIMASVLLIIPMVAIFMYKRFKEVDMWILKATTYDRDNPTPVTREYEVYDEFRPQEYISDVSRAGNERVVFDSEPKMIKQKLALPTRGDFNFYRLEWSVYELNTSHVDQDAYRPKRRTYTRYVCVRACNG